MEDLNQLANIYLWKMLTLNGLFFAMLGMVVSILNWRLDFIDREKFYARLKKAYTILAITVAFPLFGGLMFGRDGAFVGGLVVFSPLGFLLVLLHPFIMTFMTGLLLANIITSIAEDEAA
jgi:hypothetical protein